MPAAVDVFCDAFERGDAEAVAAVDDLPVWSAPFGLALMATVRMRRGLDVLDVGCGSGFPTLELAARLGTTCTVTGLDPWGPVLVRGATKARLRGLGNVRWVQSSAEEMPFPDASMDLIVSNNGLNNVADVELALARCAAAARPGAQLVMTANLPETFAIFYAELERKLTADGLHEALAAVRAHVREKRKPVDEWRTLLQAAGFEVRSAVESRFDWSFCDATAMLDHWLIRLGFLPAWQAALPPARAEVVLDHVRLRLDALAAERGGLHLEVPFVTIDAVRRVT